MHGTNRIFQQTPLPHICLKVACRKGRHIFAIVSLWYMLSLTNLTGNAGDNFPTYTHTNRCVYKNLLKTLHEIEGACKCTLIMRWVYSDNTDSLQPCRNGYTQLCNTLCLDYLLTSCCTLGSVSSSSESPTELDSSSSKFPTVSTLSSTSPAVMANYKVSNSHHTTCCFDDTFCIVHSVCI